MKNKKGEAIALIFVALAFLVGIFAVLKPELTGLIVGNVTEEDKDGKKK